MTTKRRAPAEARRLAARVRGAVERGADAAESIHKRVARLPLAPFEGVAPLEGAVADLQRLQDRSIGAVYDLVRDVNQELIRLAEQWLAPRTRRPKRRSPRRRARAKAPPQAA